MELLGFELGKRPAVEILHAGAVWDLHNAAELLGFTYNAQSRTLHVDWMYFRENASRSLCRITFNDVSDYKVSERDPQMPSAEDYCLKSMEVNREKDVFRFVFRGGHVVDVMSATAAFSTEPWPAYCDSRPWEEREGGRAVTG